VELSVGQIAKRKDRFIQQLLKIRVDGCNLIGFQSKNRILNAVLKKLIQSGNYPDSCPLLAVSFEQSLSKVSGKSFYIDALKKLALNGRSYTCNYRTCQFKSRCDAICKLMIDNIKTIFGPCISKKLWA